MNGIERYLFVLLLWLALSNGNSAVDFFICLVSFRWCIFFPFETWRALSIKIVMCSTFWLLLCFFFCFYFFLVLYLYLSLVMMMLLVVCFCSCCCYCNCFIYLIIPIWCYKILFLFLLQLFCAFGEEKWKWNQKKSRLPDTTTCSNNKNVKN